MKGVLLLGVSFTELLPQKAAKKGKDLGVFKPKGKPRGRQKGWRKHVKFGQNEDLTTIMVTRQLKETIETWRKPGERLNDTIRRLIGDV